MPSRKSNRLSSRATPFPGRRPRSISGTGKPALGLSHGTRGEKTQSSARTPKAVARKERGGILGLRRPAWAAFVGQGKTMKKKVIAIGAIMVFISLCIAGLILVHIARLDCDVVPRKSIRRVHVNGFHLIKDGIKFLPGNVDLLGVDEFLLAGHTTRDPAYGTPDDRLGYFVYNIVSDECLYGITIHELEDYAKKNRLPIPSMRTMSSWTIFH
ncbi:hypothetical protein BH11PLA1_BH11PLA1_22930 [soil metagenome]